MGPSILSEKDKNTRTFLILTIIVLALSCISIFLTTLTVQADELAIKNKEAEYVASIERTARAVDISSNIREGKAKKIVRLKSIPSYSVAQVQSLDLRKPSGVTADDLRMVTSGGLVGLEESFVEAEKKYGVNCVFLMSIASEESAKGTMMFRPNNMFGYGRSGFSSKSEGIQVVASALGSKYLQPGGSLYGGSPTISGVNKRYCVGNAWTGKVANYMAGYYSVISAHRAKVIASQD